MREAGFLALGLLLILAQSAFYRFLNGAWAVARLAGSPFGFDAEAPRWLMHGTTPNLVLPIVVYLGVQEPSMARGALLAFGLGYLLDVVGSAPIGLFTFVCVALWWLARVLGVRLTAQTLLTRISLAFGFSLLESGVILVLLAIFGADNRRPVEMLSLVLPRAATTALFAPFVFRLAQGIGATSIKSTRPEATD